VGHERAVRLGRQVLDERERGRAAVDDRHLAGLPQLRRRLRDRALAFDGLLRPLGIRRRDGRARHRAAVHALEQAGLGELLEVAADRVTRDAEPVGQLGVDEPPLAREELQDPPLALLLQHAAGSSPGPCATSLPCARASSTISSAPADAPPMRTTASQRSSSCRATGGEEDLVEGGVADPRRARELDQRQRDRLARDRHVAAAEHLTFPSLSAANVTSRQNRPSRVTFPRSSPSMPPFTHAGASPRPVNQRSAATPGSRLLNVWKMSYSMSWMSVRKCLPSFAAAASSSRCRRTRAPGTRTS
jgi:hypothetical protein